MAESLVVFENVEKRFGDTIAVDRMNLDIRKGEFLVIMGSSGCGKTTTLRMLAGLDAPTQGEIRLEGRRINDLATWRRDTPMVWQSLALFPFLDVLQNVEFGLKMRGMDRARRRGKAMEWLDRMGIAEFARRDISQLSGGQRQRVALARSLVTEPEILLLDEPLSSLDAHLKVRMQAILSNLQKELGITFVYVTHSQSEAFAMGDRIVIMSRGRIEQIGAPVEIYRTPYNHFVAEFLGSSNIFQGRMAPMDGVLLPIETGQGRFYVNASGAGGKQEGASTTFVVGNDRMVLSEEQPGDARNVLEGRVIGEEFVGATVTIHIETGDGQEIRAQKSHDEIAHLNTDVGTRIFASWLPESAYVLPGE
ncbi:MAG: ABC transporter ATP-binding protein [bacterium]|nr:ABC transporter ATP-binding protein [bacterium]